ncbi:hypothetical protein F5146DRAFT_1052223 [Armillaria mellea]|nr:hypothetical protein F5146DRAFT_1052223 [Armillaria mellea]
MSTPRPPKRRRVMSGPDGFTTPKTKPETPRFESAFQTTTAKKTPPPKPRSKANPFAFVVDPPNSNPKLKALQPPPPPPPGPSLKLARPPVLPASARRLHHLNSILSSEPADLASVFLPTILPEPADADLTQSPSKRGKFLRGGLASRASALFGRSHTALTLWKSDNDNVEPAVRLVVVSVEQDGVVFCERQARFPLSTPPALTPVLLSGLTTPLRHGEQLFIYNPYQTLPIPHKEPLLLSARYRVSAA